MGYDMTWRRIDDSEREAVAEARVAWDAAVKARDALPREEAGTFDSAKAKELGDWDAHDAHNGRTERYRKAQDSVMAASRLMDDVHTSYFRLNIWGMGLYRELMLQLGMAFDDEPHPAWPKVEDYGVTNQQVWAVEDPNDHPQEYAAITPEVMQQVLAYQGEHERVLSWHGLEVPGLPLHKFGSNDGWIVLPVECEAAVRIWRKHKGLQSEAAVRARLGSDDAFAYWLTWIAFLEGGVTHNGFEVW
ncbi:hypothetical protein [Spongiactinospora sp. TRM90649]|uniref:hypothetical protein n=1 Tax=Spongiactinospora sp. TRM90649 TaxID=3031114 RepID=UPI0023F685EE|nr:hypothetical protein [Spongiactinospora sp. TRM90649]MDF5756591.1 hypothetical protein [Spongiactinospora sp. TRM90649]